MIAAPNYHELTDEEVLAAPPARTRRAVVALRDTHLGGLAALEAWLSAPSCTDVICDTECSLVRVGGYLRAPEPPLGDADELLVLIEELKRSASYERDWVKGRHEFVDDNRGWRIFATKDWGASPELHVRRLLGGPQSLDELRDRHAFPPVFGAWIRTALDARANILIGGPTGVGKTSFLAALVREVGDTQLVKVVEDVPELRLMLRDIPTVKAWRAAPANVEGLGERKLADLVYSALRSDADRIVVGEVRGEEARWMVDGLRSGGGYGSLGSIHGRHVRDSVDRLRDLAISGGLDRDTAPASVAAAVQFVVQMGMDAAVGRRVVEVAQLCGAPSGLIALNTIWASVGPSLQKTNHVEGWLGEVMA
jgi:Flp pilus assembly CpaF family ATPase